MKLLILTQKVNKNDAILGFFHLWIEEFAKHCESVTVICLEKGEYNLPESVKVLSLGKEEGRAKAEYISRFYRYIWAERDNYDQVFVHMNLEYVILGGILWKLLGKKIAMWYVHRSSPLALRLAEKLVDRVFTSAKESFRIKSNKVIYLGHGIDVARFKESFPDWGKIKVLHVGRITRIKNIRIILEAVKNLIQRGTKIDEVKFVGETVTADDTEYKKSLSKLDLGEIVKWVGPVNYNLLPQSFGDSTLSINAAPTGGMDKVVLESLIARRAVFYTNEAFHQVFGDKKDLFWFKENDSTDLAEKISNFLKLDTEEKNKIISDLNIKVRRDYSLETLIRKIVQNI